MRFRQSRILIILLCSVMMLTMISTAAFASETKWMEELTADGWMKVTQTDGATLGYSPDSGVKLIEADGYAFKDLNKNGVLDPYEDWRLDAKTRAVDLTSQLSIEDIAGLMLQTGGPDGGTGVFADKSKEFFKTGFRAIHIRGLTDVDLSVSYNNAIQGYVESLPFGIPIEVHGEAANYQGSSGTSADARLSVWPTNLGIAATFDPSIAYDLGRFTSKEFRAVGITTLNTPQMDLLTEPRWSRQLDAFTEDPALAKDMASAYVNGLQSTYAADGTDLGWGIDSVNATMKHFPGDGTGESGRESHYEFGKFTVYPGDQFYTQLIPFNACLNLEGKTESVAGVMPSYSIAIDANGKPLGNESTGSGFNSYKLNEVLRDEMGFQGAIILDYGIITGRPWGVEELSIEERLVLAIAASADRITSFNDKDAMLNALALYAEKYGQAEMEERIQESAIRITKNSFQIGLFDNPYLSLKDSKATVKNNEAMQAGFEAQLKAITMVKNEGNIIHDTSGTDKPTVYIPFVFSPSKGWDFPLQINIVRQYVNIVTDKLSNTLTGPADRSGNPTAAEADVIRASDSEIANCDYALVVISSPINNGRQSGYNPDTKEYIPISLQYRPYTANSAFVRKTSISGNPETVTVEDPYGAQAMIVTENRSYFGKTSMVTNESHLDTVQFAVSRIDDVVVVVKTANPLVFAEFENDVDAILLYYGFVDGFVDNNALLQVVTGQVEPSGLLPFQMPANMETVEAQYEDVPREMECYVDANGNTYDFAFGLNWSGVINDERVAKYHVKPLEE